MKKLLKMGLALTLAVVIVIFGAQTVLADANEAANHVKGVISAVNTATSPKTITITRENGTTVQLQVPSTTVITKISVGTITINDLTVNDKVAATYNTDASGNKIAGTITVTPPLGKRHAFEGVIKTITAATTTTPTMITVTTNQGEQTFRVNAGTEYQVPGLKNASLTNFQVGNKVSVATVEVTTATSPTIVTVQVALRLTLIPAKPVKVSGVVTAYIAATPTTAGSLTVKDEKNVTTVFVINGDTKIIVKKGTGVTVGARVMVIGSHNLSGGPLVAKSIHVLKVKNTEHGQEHQSGSPEHGKSDLEHGNNQSQNGNQGNKNK